MYQKQPYSSMERLLTQDLGQSIAPMSILVIHQSYPIVPCFASCIYKTGKATVLTSYLTWM